jgi:hypothetical protein
MMANEHGSGQADAVLRIITEIWNWHKLMRRHVRSWWKMG